MQTQEHNRLEEAVAGGIPWRRWGPYLSERQWGTVREDYSDDGNAWDYFPHEHARSRAYRWGEDGMCGLCDEKMQMCLAVALWNGNDPFLKERMFGLTNPQGNHGEDVKDYYYYLDSTPSHSFMRMLYKYPHAAFPYEDLVTTNGARGGDEPEYELIDTGVFDDDRYHDIYVEYAKDGPDEVLVRISVTNRGPDATSLHVLPHLWFRNTWWMAPDEPKPSLRVREGTEGAAVVEAHHPTLGDYHLYCEGAPALLFTENETNNQLLFGRANASPFVKDAVNDFVVHGRRDAVNPAREARRWRRTTRWTSRPVNPEYCSCGSAPQRVRRGLRSARASMQRSLNESGKPTSSTRRSPRPVPARTQPTSCGRDMPGSSSASRRSSTMWSPG